jgi:hypothetical protein
MYAAPSCNFKVGQAWTIPRPEGGVATTRFLVLQHERRRRAVLGPRENQRNKRLQ